MRVGQRQDLCQKVASLVVHPKMDVITALLD